MDVARVGRRSRLFGVDRTRRLRRIRGRNAPGVVDKPETAPSAVWTGVSGRPFASHGRLSSRPGRYGCSRRGRSLPVSAERRARDDRVDVGVVRRDPGHRGGSGGVPRDRDVLVVSDGSRRAATSASRASRRVHTLPLTAFGRLFVAAEQARGAPQQLATVLSSANRSWPKSATDRAAAPGPLATTRRGYRSTAPSSVPQPPVVCSPDGPSPVDCTQADAPRTDR